MTYPMVAAESIPRPRIFVGIYERTINEFLTSPEPLVSIEPDLDKIPLKTVYGGFYSCARRMGVGVRVSVRTHEGKIYLSKEGRQN